MEKIKMFLKKYGSLILLGILVFLIILTIILFQRKSGDGNKIEIDIQASKVDSPYFLVGYDVDISLPEEYVGFDSVEPIIQVVRPRDWSLGDFLGSTFGLNTDIVIWEDYFHFDEFTSVVYISSSSILTLESRKTYIPLPFNVNSEKDLQIFLSEYFNIREINNKQVYIEEGKNIYEGEFKFDAFHVGSSELGGYAYRVVTNNLGNLEKLEILLIEKESEFAIYQGLPTSNLDELLQIDRYPMKIVHKKVTERLEDNYIISRLLSLTVKDVEKKYIFNSFETPFIYPTYILTGDGLLEDTRGRTHWSLSQVYICAISPDFLYEREIVEFPNLTDPAPDIREPGYRYIE
jgi:hypothetical protein